MSKEPNLKRMSKEEIDEIKIDAYMSKEQTPITAEEFLKKYVYEPKTENLQDAVINAMEQYAQAKVLEALERELSFVWFWDDWDWTDREKEISEQNFKHYYETEVKPKYKVK